MSTATVDPETGEILSEAEPNAPEPEQPDEDEDEEAGDDETKAPPAPELPQSARSEKEIGKTLDKLEAEAVRHAKRVQEIMGDDAEGLVPCPLDFTPGFVMPELVAGYDPERIAAALVLLGVGGEPDYLPDPDTETCSQCDGYGQTLSGAKTEHGKLKACAKCGGNGWTTKALAPTAPPHLLPPAPPGAIPVLSPDAGLPPRPEPYFNPATQAWELPT